MHILDTLAERGFLKQITFEDDLRKLLGEGQVVLYVGFDPTADSLHIGHYIPIMAMAHMQRAGHRPIALMGGGTAMVGDPSGRTDLRQMLTKEQIAANVEAIRKQMERFLDFGDGGAQTVNNADWLTRLNYIDFLRDVGSLFSVNRMLTAECYKQRLERGLTFLEFNYMIMQAYDFLVLSQRYGCALQMGGDDQWSNILAGADLIRRKEQKDAFALTFPLLLTHDGVKMGKTAKGALWLDPRRTSPFEFFQYFRNVDDADVEKCLALLTFLPMEEVRRLGRAEGGAINESKRILAFETTRLVHGQEEAEKAMAAAEALFSGGEMAGSVPTTHLTSEELREKHRVIDMMLRCGLVKSLGEARRLIAGGGVTVNGKTIESADCDCCLEDFGDDGLMLRKGKKGYHRVLLDD